MPPILIERAKGLKLYDCQGNSYYDTISSWWCNVHGHSHPKITKAISGQAAQLEHVLFAGFTHKPAIELAKKLVQITPKSLTKVFYSDNGSTAAEAAIKMSFQYWQNTGKPKKKKFVSLDHAYHGDTVGAMSLSGVGLFNSVFKPLFFPGYKVPSPYCYRCPANKKASNCGLECAKKLEAILKKNHSRVSGVILEPLLMAAGGMIIYPVKYLKKVARLAKKYNVHLIADEVATGFGRTGEMFACEHAGIEPDFICISKGITSGCLPLAATLTTEEVYKAFYADYEKQKTFYHGHTYTANPISCAAALASLEVFKQEKTLKKVKISSKIFHRELESFRSLKLVGDVRYIGLVGALELVKNKKTKQPFGIKERIGLDIYKRGLKEGIILRPLGNIVYLFLPLSVREKEMRVILRKTKKCINFDKTRR